MRVLRLPEVQAKTGKGRSAIYDAIQDGSFPAPIPTGAKTVGWVESEIDDWIKACIAERDDPNRVATKKALGARLVGARAAKARDPKAVA